MYLYQQTIFILDIIIQERVFCIYFCNNFNEFMFLGYKSFKWQMNGVLVPKQIVAILFFLFKHLELLFSVFTKHTKPCK